MRAISAGDLRARRGLICGRRGRRDADGLPVRMRVASGVEAELEVRGASV
jgi:hypothetical protein